MSKLIFQSKREYTYEKVKTIADWILERIDIQPKIGIVCGSGLGGLGDRLENPNTIPYSEIPNFPKSTGSFITLSNYIY